MKETLAVLGEAADAARDAVLGRGYTRAEQAAFLFDVAIIQRGLNLLRAIQLLCGEGYWEFAAPMLRQLFELVVNMEHLAAEPDRSVGMRRYVQFGLLQAFIRERDMLRYSAIIGRPIDADRLEGLEELLRTNFKPFRAGRNADGSYRWSASWSRRTTKDLVTASPMRLRRDQHQLSVAEWSDQIHANPNVLISTMFPGADFDEVIATDEVRIAETVGSAVSHFIELWALLPGIPPPSPEHVRRWFVQLLASAKKYGAEPPPDPR